MTQQLSALGELISADAGASAVAAFYEQWKHERLVVDKWFGMQIAHAAPSSAAEITHRLTEHADFNYLNPNCFRAVLGSLAMNTAGFHHESGNSYKMMADWLIKLDAANPQTTARMCSAFETWRRFDGNRQSLIRSELQRIASTKDLSRDTAEMVGRILG